MRWAAEMAGGPLFVLQALRRREVETARHALAACLQAEAGIADRIRSLDDAARRDRAVSDAWQDRHQFLELAAIRLAAARAERSKAALQLTAAAARSQEARDLLTAARTAAEAVDQLIDERVAAAQAEAARRAQHELDDIARAARRRGAR